MAKFKPKGLTAQWVPAFNEIRTADYDQVFTFDWWQKTTGCDVSGTSRSVVDAVRKRLEAYEHRTLVAVPRVGYRVAQPSEHIDLSKLHQKKSARQVKRAMSKVTSADRTALGAEDRARLDAQELHLQRIDAFARQLARTVDRHKVETDDKIERVTMGQEVEQADVRARLASLEQQLLQFNQRNAL